MTRVVLNVCGIKSKGGITVLNNFLKNNSNLDLYIIYDNLDLENHVSRYKNQFIRVPRFCHPFLNLFINKNLKETINTVEDDMKKLEDRIKQAQKELEEKMDKRIKLALENPLGAM